MFEVIIMILGIIGILLQFYMRKYKEEEKSLILVYMQYIVMVLIVVVTAYLQVNTSRETEKYRFAKIEFDILSQVGQLFVPVMENIIEIQNNYFIVSNYLSIEKAKLENPMFAPVIDKASKMNQAQLEELNKSIAAFEELRGIAIKIVGLNATYNGMLPKEIVDWSILTAKMKFEDVERYLDPYSPVGMKPKDTVMKYYFQTGQAFGVVLGNINKSLNILKSKNFN
jgi:hypothetical protein